MKGVLASDHIKQREGVCHARQADDRGAVRAPSLPTCKCSSCPIQAMGQAGQGARCSWQPHVPDLNIYALFPESLRSLCSSLYSCTMPPCWAGVGKTRCLLLVTRA